MIRYLLLLFTISLFFSCSPQKLSGNYKAGGNLLDRGLWYLKGKTKFFAGNRLTLNPDSSFHFTSCGCTSSGTWSFAHDTVFLNYEAVQQITDSSEVNCYLPPYFSTWRKTLIGENQGKYIEIMRKAD